MGFEDWIVHLSWATVNGKFAIQEYWTQGAERATPKCSEPDCKDINTGKARLYCGQNALVTVLFQSHPADAHPFVLCK